MKNKFEIDSACCILGLQLEQALNFLADHQVEVQALDGKHYTDEIGIEELEKLAKTRRDE